MFAPIALILILIFASFSLLMVPFAYLMAIYHKLRILSIILRKDEALI